MSLHFITYIVLIAVPLIVGIVLLILALRFKLRFAGTETGMASIIFLPLVLFGLVMFGPYMWALHLESRWRPANPKTLAELESMLSLYTKKEIVPEQSERGPNYKLEPGEQMIRYSILGQPLDVTFTHDQQIVSIHTAYE